MPLSPMAMPSVYAKARFLIATSTQVIDPGSEAAGDARRARPRVEGRFLSVGGRRFWIKGVTYGTFRPNEDCEPYPPRAQVREDFDRMREAGVNTVRLYSPPPDWLADAASE